ncbi:MAG: hypothetical protein KKH22_06710 [Proteobacteria bacterium]|nr:hypothetical protein [Pseudomonadota bacterium]
MTESGFSRACAARLERIKKLAEVSSTDPHAAYCRECKGLNRPVELEIISMEGMIMGTQQTSRTGAEPKYTLPPALAKVLKPISHAEAQTITLKDLMEFWRRPLIKIGQASECPCCGNIRTLKCRGLCGGCNSAKVAKQNLAGPALLEHLAMRAGGDKNIQTEASQKTNQVSTSPVMVPSSPAAPPAVAGQVECNDPLKNLTTLRLALCRSLGLDDNTPWYEIPEHVDKLVMRLKDRTEENDILSAMCGEVADILGAGAADNLSQVARRRKDESAMAIREINKNLELRQEIASLNRLLATHPLETPAATEESIVAKWSALPAPDGYEALTAVLQDAIDQAANGKGLERHADDQPFHNQPIMRETQAVGLGFPAGQARKKILEAVRGCDDHPERAVADLLGAINYIAALVIAIRSSIAELAA